MSILNQNLELMVADCNLLRSKNTELIQQVQQMNERIYQMELALQSWKEEPPKESNTGSLTGDEIESIISLLELEETITEQILCRTDWDDLVEVDLSLSGNEIETSVDSERWKIERYISRELSQLLEESLREILQNFNTGKEVSDDSI
jgi:hypothetical protein